MPARSKLRPVFSGIVAAVVSAVGSAITAFGLVLVNGDGTPGTRASGCNCHAKQNSSTGHQGIRETQCFDFCVTVVLLRIGLLRIRLVIGGSISWYRWHEAFKAFFEIGGAWQKVLLNFAQIMKGQLLQATGAQHYSCNDMGL